MAALEAYDRSAPLVVLPLEDRAGAGVETAENYDRPGGSDGGSGPHSSVIDEMRMMTIPGSKCSSVMELEKGPGLQPEGQLRAGDKSFGPDGL